MWGVIWFIFHVLQLLLIRFTWHYSCCIGKSILQHLQKPDRKSDVSWYISDYRMCMFVDFLIGYLGLSNCVHYWMQSSYEQCNPISFSICIFMMFALWSLMNHIPNKYRGAIRKTSHLRTIYLTPNVWDCSLIQGMVENIEN